MDRGGPPWTAAFTAWLDRSPIILSLYGGVMAFGAYFAMYAYRKPFSAAEFQHVGPIGVDYKMVLVVAQLVGYALSKFIGVKVISELPARWRALSILGLIAAAELALVGFAAVPPPYNLVCMFLNGAPLGLIWGLVFGFVEGRRTSEILGSMMCASFIVSSGVVKAVGKALLLNHAAGDFTMPMMVGLLFTPVLLACVFGLTLLPAPNAADVQARVARAPMMAEARGRLLRDFAPGLIALITLYVMLTSLRDFRDNFAAEIWTDLGRGNSAEVFALSELPIGAVVLGAMALLSVFKSNRSAVMANLALMGLGLAVAGLSSLAMRLHLIDPVLWMILVGGGVYLAYTPFSGMLFDRLVAATGTVGTAGFLIYVADAGGYAGSVGLLLIRGVGGLKLPWADFLISATLISAALGVALLLYAARYFFKRLRQV